MKGIKATGLLLQRQVMKCGAMTASGREMSISTLKESKFERK
jgi:hypothetical protein